MNLDEAILYARIEGPGPHVAQQALGLLVGEIDRLRRLEARPAADTLLDIAREIENESENSLPSADVLDTIANRLRALAGTARQAERV